MKARQSSSSDFSGTLWNTRLFLLDLLRSSSTLLSRASSFSFSAFHSILTFTSAALGRDLIRAVSRTAFRLQKPRATEAPIWSPVVHQMLQVANPRRHPQERPAVVYLTDSSQTIGGRCLKYHGDNKVCDSMFVSCTREFVLVHSFEVLQIPSVRFSDLERIS